VGHHHMSIRSSLAGTMLNMELDEIFHRCSQDWMPAQPSSRFVLWQPHDNEAFGDNTGVKVDELVEGNQMQTTEMM
jgi:hypothetical protein